MEHRKIITAKVLIYIKIININDQINAYFNVLRSNLRWTHFEILRNKESLVPDAGQPVGDQSKGTHEEEEDGGAILGVTVQLPGHANQSQQASCFQQTNQGGGLGENAGVTGLCCTFYKT